MKFKFLTKDYWFLLDIQKLKEQSAVKRKRPAVGNKMYQLKRSVVYELNIQFITVYLI